ncbi:MAG: YeeE/YedE family protein [Alphaproteobacteria bacterium]|nr:YeeE/YedE family protein [Alphaproteobacteria bacterium]
MVRNLAALAVGTLFGLGLAISHMVDPGKVKAFLDVAGDWDPSLCFVMGGAVVVAFLGFRLAQRRSAPLLDHRFFLARNRQTIDSRLAIGAALFGVGWGIAGVCPGPALSSVTYALWDTVIFLVAMAVGAAAARLAMPPLAAAPLPQAAP